MEIKQDRLTLIQEKAFIGREFLTWLWYRTELRGGVVDVPGEGDLAVSFERFIVLDTGEGTARESVTCQGPSAELLEAKTGLRTGKKVARARIRMGRDDDQWVFTIDGKTLDITSLKIKRGISSNDDEADDDLALEARAIEKAHMLFRACESLDLLFKAFMEIRLDPDAWQEESGNLEKWLFPS